MSVGIPQGAGSSNGAGTGIAGFESIGRIPLPGDNAAIAIRRLEAGTRFQLGDAVHTLAHTILEGHRFAVAPISAGEYLLSWNLPFGKALRSIAPGEYLCNAGVLDALRLRQLDFPLPRIANFQNAAAAVSLEDATYSPGEQVALYPEPGTFMGFTRKGGRGVGTRNMIVLLGTTSSTASFVRQLEDRLREETSGYPNIDAIVAVAHTEGSGTQEPNNMELLLRTLAGMLVHPNVAAVLAVDLGTEVLNNERLLQYAEKHGYPLADVPHRFYTLGHDLSTSLGECAAIVRQWFELANSARREPSPLAELKIGLQCGGSDAFSGISGNPLVGWVAGELIRHGGAASLAETDELMGAEPYILANTRNITVARSFLAKLAAFRERISWHGHSAEGNPTGGNLFRGLYNISLKSIGAARKKDPGLRLDHVIDYAQRMPDPGFYFMDSPGNDLESIAGQVGSGCNLIFFTTGNGSITNFPFVPTIKFVTTTRRWNLLSQDMDINAGRYLDGETMDSLGRESFEYTVAVASGQRSVGERAGHSQVSIWRNWCQTDSSQLERIRAQAPRDGKPIGLRPANHPAPLILPRDFAEQSSGQLGLIMPTSLCAGQIAVKIAAELNRMQPAFNPNITRFVGLPHTEGCGTSSGENEAHYLRTVVGHLQHPLVRDALLLEHGCEHTHNDLMRHTLKSQGVDAERFGFASIQLDGGIDKVTARVVDWFHARAHAAPAAPVTATMSVGLTSAGPVAPVAARAMARLAVSLINADISVVVPRSASLVQAPSFWQELGLPADDLPPDSLDYGQVARNPGFHLMATPGAHFVEALTGLGGTGVSVILALVQGPPVQGHPMIPTLQVATEVMPGGMPAKDEARDFRRDFAEDFAKDFDAVFDLRDVDPDQMLAALQGLVVDTLSGHRIPGAWSRGYTDFQVTRGLLGVSL